MKKCIKTEIPQEKPSSLWHYTSFETLTHILDTNNECMENRRMLSLHFGNLLQTNDLKEVHFFEEYVYKHKGGEKLKETIETIRPNIGYPFSFSLIHHKEIVKKYPSFEIPMWKMYGKNFCGVRLKFNYKKMKEYCKSFSDIDLKKCQYYSKTQMEDRGKTIRKTYQDEETVIANLESVYKDSVVYKTYDWVYENEWRIVKWVKDINMVDYSRETGRLYIKQEIPLDCLEIIEIGPKADQTAFHNSLDLIQKK